MNKWRTIHPIDVSNLNIDVCLFYNNYYIMSQRRVLQKMEAISRYLRDLTTAMEDVEKELAEAL
jgi:hypothetical protein